MACQAPGIIEHRIALQFTVRIVTGDATDSRIIDKVGLALEHSVGLKPNVVNPALVCQKHDGIEALMARAAEFLHLVESVQRPWIEYAQIF